MPRRKHKKSRNGCLECKRRHVKCDEKRPQCTPCTVSERSCEYAGPFRRVNPGPSPASSSTPSSTATATAPTSIPATQTASPSPYASDPPPANMLHFELLHHFLTETWPSLDDTFPTQLPTLFPVEIAKVPLAAPYLLNELLAFSALHKSVIAHVAQPHHPHHADFYHYHASQLQTHALTLFNNRGDDLTVTADTCVPLFLFSSTLGLHTLCDALVCRPHQPPDDFESFLDAFVASLRLHNGVRSIARKSWALLRESALQPFLLHAEARFRGASDDGDGLDVGGCAALMARIEGAKLGAEITATYAATVDALKRALHAHGHAGGRPSVIGATAWPVLVGVDYIELLQLRRPEALVILAHYAVLIHDCRKLWVFGDGGRFLICSIARYLGSEWEEWLEWPLEALRDVS
ncbi:hypothetical protein BJX96DRAFT_172766 [Aspergillus floccosus]